MKKALLLLSLIPLLACTPEIIPVERKEVTHGNEIVAKELFYDLTTFNLIPYDEAYAISLYCREGLDIQPCLDALDVAYATVQSLESE